MDNALLMAIVLLLLAVAFMVAEVFLPSLGMLGAACVACVVSSVWFAFQVNATTGWSFLVAAAVGMPALLVAFLRVFPDTAIGRRYILEAPRGPLQGSAGSTAAMQDMLGNEGVARTALRPAGIAEIAGRRVDVVSEGLPVDAGGRVVVTRVDGNRVVVRAVQTEVS